MTCTIQDQNQTNETQETHPDTKRALDELLALILAATVTP